MKPAHGAALDDCPFRDFREMTTALSVLSLPGPFVTPASILLPRSEDEISSRFGTFPVAAVPSAGKGYTKCFREVLRGRSPTELGVELSAPQPFLDVAIWETSYSFDRAFARC